MIYWDNAEVFGRDGTLALTVSGHDLMHCSRVYAANGARLNAVEHKAWIRLITKAPKLAEFLRDAITERGAMAERSHGFAMKRLQAISDDAEALLAELNEVTQEQS